MEDQQAPDDTGVARAVAMATPPVTRSGKQRKPSWVDRPKHPKDWRWVVGGIGRILIVTGLLMFLFVGYQLWGTGIQTARAQNALENEFEQLLADAATSTLPSTTAPATTSSVVDTVPITDTVPVTDGSGSTPAVTTAPATATTAAPTTTAAPRAPAPPTPSPGKALARLEIPRMGHSSYVVRGVSTSNLRNGPGHFPETPMPGQLGNSAIAGHRTTYGAPFGNLDRLQAGDQIIATTLSGRYVYQVTGSVIVGGNDYGKVIPTTDWSQATLTLVTCHPRYTAQQRLVVFSRLIASESAPVSEFTPPPTTAPPVTQPPATAAPTSVAATSVPAATLPGETLPTDTLPADTLPGETVPVETLPVDTLPGETVPAVIVPPPDGGNDAFSEGWFSDPTAWWHVAAWGLVLASVTIGAYWIARVARRRWVGVLVGITPFFVVLYFWFENINRLLPPSL